MTYQRRRLSWNPSHDKPVPLRQGGIDVSHAPFSVSCRRIFSPALSSSYFRLINAAFSEKSRCFCPSSLTLHTYYLCAMQLRSVPPRSDPTRTSLADSEVLYARSADIRGSGIPRPPRIKLRPRVSMRLALTSYPTKSVGKKTSLRESSIGLIREPTPGTVLYRYCHLICINTPNPAYEDWG